MNAPADRNAPWLAEYQALVEHAGLVELGRRTQIEITGNDRAAWLNNLTTNEIRKLAIGAGCETFLTTVQGKTLAHAFVFALPDSLVLDTVPGQAKTILNHLERYHIREDATLVDRSDDWDECLLVGAGADALLAQWTGTSAPGEHLAHTPAVVSGHTVWVRRVDVAGSVGFFVCGPRDESDWIRRELLDAGAVACGEAAFAAARIERGFPWFGIDLSADNLPQELARDAAAISFVKGCYLGQETVARIDALGHVNKTLCGVRFAGSDVPAAGTELSADGKPAGHVTSAANSPKLGAPLALAYLRRGANEPGTRLTSSAGDAEVVTLPVG